MKLIGHDLFINDFYSVKNSTLRNSSIFKILRERGDIKNEKGIKRKTVKQRGRAG